ncbi:MAG: hypothetical protein HY744_16085 [Deltaproteobacteria bacterium]|nr:hypothetical protein [Deltaproteobacteria bacterium]
MAYFCLQSLLREYGWQFLWRVLAPHPVRTTTAVLSVAKRDFWGDKIVTSPQKPGPSLGGPRSIVGVGFCLKPLDPPCLSGRANHECFYLERLLHAGTPEPPDCCKICAIREMGIETLKAGAAFYIMTSARDILSDVFTPALNERRFSAGLFLLCRYSLRPFTVGLLASGIQGWMFPFERGDCADYRTWLLADRGIKDEQTRISEQSWKDIHGLLDNAAKDPSTVKRFDRRGNVLVTRSRE